MAATSTTEQWDAAWTTTMRAAKKDIVDNIFDAYPTLEFFQDNMETEEGGKEIQVNLMYAKNTAQAFDGYDTLNTDAVDGVTAGFVPFRYYAVPITISQTEEWENRLPATRMSLLETKTKQAMLTLRDTVNAAIYSAQSGKNMLGLQDWVSDTPTVGTLAGISRANESWWRNTADTTATTFLTQTTTNVFDGFTRFQAVMDAVEEGNETVSNIFTTRSIVQAYRQALSSAGYARTELNNSQSMGVKVPRNPSWYGSMVQADRDCASLHAYFLQKKYIRLHVMSGVNFAKTPFKENSNQLAKVAYIVVGLQLVSDNIRRLGVATAITGI
jgi:hypothetical protein